MRDLVINKLFFFLCNCVLSIRCKIVVKQRTNLSASLHSSTTSVLSLHCLQCRALHLGFHCLSYHLLQIGITITATISLRSQHLCSLSSTSGTSWKIGQALKPALFSLLCFIFFLCLPVLFAPLPSLFLTSFHLLFLSSWSFLYFFILPISPSSFSSFISSSCQFSSPYFHFFPFLPVFTSSIISSLSFFSLTPSHEINIQKIWMCPKHILYNSLNEWAS